MASFRMPFRACVLHQEKKFSYDKFYFGSFKDYVPDYYKLGYYLASYSRIKYGKDIWNQTLDYVGKFSFLPYALQVGLKNTYNTSRNKIFHETIDTLKSLWNNEYANLNLTSYSNIPIEQTADYKSYRYVHPLNDGSVISFKTSIDELRSIVRIDSTGKESILHIPGITFENRLSAGSDIVVWDEIVADARWEQRNYSVIKSFNLLNGKLESLTCRSRIFSPCISSEDQKIAAIRIDEENNSSVVIIDALTKNEIFSKTAPEPGLLNFPVWYGSDTVIAVFTTRNHGKHFYALDLTTGSWKKFFTPTFYNISQISLWNEYLLFSADFSGIDNIYALNLENSKLYQITSSRHGAFDPFADKESEMLYYSQYTVNGFRPVKAKLKRTNWIMFGEKDFIRSEWVAELTKQENISPVNDIPVKKNYAAKRYSRFSGLFNIHSWMPFYFKTQSIASSDPEIRPGFTILSQNVLSTSISSIGISYDNQKFIIRPSFIFRGFLPVFDLSATIGGPNKRHVMPADIVPKDTAFPFVEVMLKSYIPFRFLDSKYHKFLQPEIDLEYENTLYYHNVIRKGMLFFHYKLLFYRYLMLSHRDIHPKWGQVINLSFTHTPFEKSQYGILTSASGIFYFPGISKHHSLFSYCGFQYRNIRKGRYSYPVNRITLPRGYSHVMNEPLTKMTTKVSLNYGAPVIYPDFSFGSAAYIKRVRTNIFGDFAYAYDLPVLRENQIEYTSKVYSSFGLDIISDMHLFRFFFPFSLGLRITYIPDFQNVYPDILFSVDTSVF